MNMGKFLLKDNRLSSLPLPLRHQYNWIMNQQVEIDGIIYYVKEVLDKKNCTLQSIDGVRTKSNVYCEDVANNIISTIQSNCILFDRVFEFPNQSTNASKVAFPKKNANFRGGRTSVFILNYKSSTPRQNENELKEIIIRGRVESNALPIGYKFIENTNLAFLKRYSFFSRVVVAYRPSCSSTNRKLPWRLGIIGHHTARKTLIIPAILKADESGKMRYELKEHYCCNFSYGEVDLIYLNWIRGTTTTAKDGCIKSLLTGPDIIPHNLFATYHGRRLTKCRSIEANLHCTNHSIYDSNFPSVTPTAYISNESYQRPLGLWEHLHRSSYYSRKSIQHLNSESICGTGTTTITIEASMHTIMAYAKKNYYLVPYVPKNVAEPITSISYALIKSTDYNNVIKANGCNINMFNSTLDQYAYHKIEHRVVNKKDIGQGVLFCYIKNDKIPFMKRIVSEYTNTIATEHCDHKDGIILSHWCVMKKEETCNIIDWKVVSIAQRTYGRGFGNRSSVSCRGLNVYLGRKNTHRVISNTRMAREDVFNSQMWRSFYDPTYEPIFQCTAKLLTKQAARIMLLCDRTYDRLLHMFYEYSENNVHDPKVVIGKKRKYSDRDNISNGNSFVDEKRFCNWSLVTCGLSNNKCYSFVNEVHVDKNDFFPKRIQHSATMMMDKLAQKYSNKKKSQQHIQYYQRMISYFGGLCVPTTCGYHVLSKGTEGNDIRTEPIILCYFALTGLGYSVEIDSSMYQFFYGAYFSHCTPCALKIHGDKVYLYGDDFNVFAWGASGSGK